MTSTNQERLDVDLSMYSEEYHAATWPEYPDGRVDRVIRREMKQYLVSPEDFDSVCKSDKSIRPCDKHKNCRAREPRQWCVYGIGTYCCADSCQNRWKSGHSWVVVDLFRQTILRRFGQQCHRCESIEYQKPTFDLVTWVCVVRKLLRMGVKYLVDNNFITGRRANKLRQILDLPANYRENAPFRTPRVHDAFRCEFCSEYGILCTRFNFHLYESPEHLPHYYQQTR